jgi:diaminohydroxyphosphoribosylaminopyrimidine deaminase/5-amino-6-(5-phosphoribosylamino)uracil reductase
MFGGNKLAEKFSKEDIKYMKRALKLAEKGEARVSPNPMVGAVVVKNGRIVGEGYHKFYGGPHAEVYALEAAGEEALGADIYVTLEPCSHYGKTPPCANKLVSSGIKRAVVAMVDPNPEVAGRGLDILREAGIEVDLGLMSDKAKEINEVFIKFITDEYPYIYLKKAQTLDGYIASNTGDSKWITNKEARLEGHKLRHKVDAVMVGIGTVLADDPSLTTRLEDRDGIDSLRIILDPELEVPLSAKIINQKSEANTLIIAGKEAVDKKVSKFNKLNSKKQVEIITFTLNKNKFLPIKKILKLLHQKKISSILVEGGAKLSHSFLHEELIDKLYYFIAPKIYGGSDGIASFCGKGPEFMSDAKNIEIIENKKLGDNYLFIAKLQN